MTFQADAFQATAFQTVDGPITGTMAAVFSPAFSVAGSGTVAVTGTMARTFSPSFAVASSGSVRVSGAMAAGIHFSFIAAGEGTSEGLIPIIPRDIEGGISYLVEVDAYDTSEEAATKLLYSSVKITTLPTDAIPNRWFDDRIEVPGDYTRSMFSDGTTAGTIDVGVGVIDVRNDDGALDAIANFAFDGYSLIIRSVERVKPVYAEAVTIFRGTVEQIEFTWDRVRFRLRDRLAEFDTQLQTVKFAGTTIAGGMNEAEGKPDDLKDQPKPTCWGAPMCIPAVASNTFDNIFDVGQNGLQGIAEVRDKGVLLSATGIDYANVALLRAATIASGKYATCNAAGLVRTEADPQGQLTVAPLEGANAGARTAAQIARRMMLRRGMVEGTDFLSADITALDALNGAPLGFWIGTEEMTSLAAISSVLNSIGATIVPDRLGVHRMYRMDAPSGPPVMTLTKADLLERNMRGIERLPTDDEGKGVPAWKVSVKWGKNWSVMTRSELDPVNTPDSFKSFAELEWRTAVAQDVTVKDVHKLASELSFETYFVSAADARAEADRILALRKVRRDRFRVPVPSYIVEQIDLSAIIRLELPRFQLDGGKNFRVIGMSPNLETKITYLDLWG